MRVTFFLKLTVICVMTLFFSYNIFAQDLPQPLLPEGVKVRLGESQITGKIAYAPDGKRLAVATILGIWIYDTQTGKALDLLIGHADSVLGVSFSPDGNTLASGGLDGTIRLWDANTGEPRRTLEGHRSWIDSVSFSPDSNTLASGSEDRTIRLWDVDTGEPLRTLEGHTDAVFSVSFSPDGHTLASGSFDRTIRLWDVDTGEPRHTLEEHTGEVRSVSFSPDGRTLASGSLDGTIRLWDVDTGEPLHTLEGHTGEVRSVSFSPDGHTLASGSLDSTVRLWNANTGEPLRTLEGHTDAVDNVAFSPDGTTLASGSEGITVFLWEVPLFATTNATVSLSPASVQTPAVGQQLTLSLKITEGENIAGYQATLGLDTTALRFVESSNGDYLPAGAFFISPVVQGNTVKIAGTSLAGENRGDGTLATITFEVVDIKASTVKLLDVLLTNKTGVSSVPKIAFARITELATLHEDVNKDGVVNVIDLTLVASNFGKQGVSAADVNADGVVNIIDLTLVAGAFGNTAAAPEVWHQLDSVLTRTAVKTWLREASQLNLMDADFQRGLLVLEQLLAALTPKETLLLPNYPNPFNPETWIPYHLANPSEVRITIYDTRGVLVRHLDLGYQREGYYTRRSRAAYWDGRNAVGERVASGVYFYTLTTGDFSATRKMLILK